MTASAGDALEIAPGRLHLGPTIAVIDIGSNSVRLVVYEALVRSPTPIFNEKALCGLGRNVLTTGRLADEAVARALEASHGEVLAANADRAAENRRIDFPGKPSGERSGNNSANEQA